MGLGMAVLPLATDYLGLLAATAILGFGNGLGSGAMMTLGADLAPPGSSGEFLGVWRLIGDVGNAGAPPGLSATWLTCSGYPSARGYWPASAWPQPACSPSSCPKR